MAKPCSFLPPVNFHPAVYPHRSQPVQRLIWLTFTTAHFHHCFCSDIPRKLAARGLGRLTPTSRAIALHRLENEIDILGFVRTDSDLLSARTKLFVPSVEGVGEGRKVAQVEAFPVTAKRMLEYRDVATHPGMDVAPHGDGDLSGGEVSSQLGSRELSLVPFSMIHGHRVNIVRG